MGSTNLSYKLPKTLNAVDLQSWYKRAAEQDRRENNDDYSGTIGATRGIRVSSSTFKTWKEAETYVLNNTEKWGPLLAVSVTESTGCWYVGGWAAE